MTQNRLRQEIKQLVRQNEITRSSAVKAVDPFDDVVVRKAYKITRNSVCTVAVQKAKNRSLEIPDRIELIKTSISPKQDDHLIKISTNFFPISTTLKENILPNIKSFRSIKPILLDIDRHSISFNQRIQLFLERRSSRRCSLNLLHCQS